MSISGVDDAGALFKLVKFVEENVGAFLLSTKKIKVISCTPTRNREYE